MDTAAAVKILQDAIDALEQPRRNLTFDERLERARRLYDVIRPQVRADEQTLPALLRALFETEMQTLAKRRPFPYEPVRRELGVSRGAVQGFLDPTRRRPRGRGQYVPVADRPPS